MIVSDLDTEVVPDEVAAARGLPQGAAGRLSGRKYRVLTRRQYADFYSMKSRATRIYVQIPDGVIGTDQPPYGSKKGDGSAEDSAWRQYNRWEIAVMRSLVQTCLTEELRSALGMFKAEVRFSRKAGCGCGCSPGFMLDTAAIYCGYPVDIWIEEVVLCA